MNQNTAYIPEPVAPLIYLSCSAEDLILVEMEAWDRGFKQVTIDTKAALEDIVAIENVAEQACDQSLVVYVPLDLYRFRDVFTRAWCAGYCTGAGRKRQSGKPNP
jgi:hypothetical protein